METGRRGRESRRRRDCSGTGAGHTSGTRNIYIGSFGLGTATESDTIRIGVPLVTARAFVGGIHGVTVAGSSTVLINSSGQLGTVPSSGFRELTPARGCANPMRMTRGAVALPRLRTLRR